MSCSVPRFLSLGVIVLVVAQCLAAPVAYAVAYCALRDPVSTIYELFPNADNYRSVVGTVGRDVREKMKAEIPFKLHFNELGRHTLYIAQRGSEPLGLVHARSEPGAWGIDEFVWAISPSLRILDVKVQRTRDSALRKDRLDSALKPLVGMGIEDLLSLHSKVAPDGVDEKLLKSAIKTLFVTKYVWQEDLDEMAALIVAMRSNSSAHKVMQVPELYNNRVLAKLQSFDMQVSPVFDRSAVVGYQIFGPQDELAGLAVLTPLDIHSPEPVWWVVDKQGEIQYVGEVDGLNDDFSSALGYAPLNARDCSSAVDLAALEIATLARFN